ncbi:ribosomal protein L7/L12 [Candidatus Peregrinibacteria bacterium]|nr:ribosomal protein L7/L12 [Candidatus Peregrinibacteria bacterium]
MQASYTVFLFIGIVAFVVGYLIGRSSKGSTNQTPLMPGSSFGRSNSPLTMDNVGARMSKSAVHAQIMDLLARKQKIEAIKLLRMQRGLGLKEAKDYVESLESGASPQFDIGD